MSEILPAVEIEASTGPAAGAVIWLHGLGASGHDFEDVVPLLGRNDVRFVFPHAPRRPVTINMGLIMPAWYDIAGLDERSEEDSRGVTASARLVENLIARERERGVASERIVLAGFSQGGALALYTGMRHAQTLAGIMVLSGYELGTKRREVEVGVANRSTPLLGCHGVYDPMVHIQWGRAAYEAYAHPDRPSAWHEFPIAHEVSLEEIQVIRNWLAEVYRRP